MYYRNNPADSKMPSGKSRTPRVLLLYHYFYPDDVVSAQHFSQLAEELKLRNWLITAMPCNRGCHNPSETYAPYEIWNGIEIRRVWRPRFGRSSAAGRIINAFWMICAWSLAACRKKAIPDVDVLVIGTDPVLSVLVALPWKLLRPRTRVVHWCFDLYPEAAVAEGLLREKSLLVGAMNYALKRAYGACDLIADIGSCMREKLGSFHSSAKQTTLTPWALTEPAGPLGTDHSERECVFGHAKLAILYSGNFGRAHSSDLLLELAQCLRHESVTFAFSVRGNQSQTLKQAVENRYDNITFVPFASRQQLAKRLSAADIHVASLKPEWTGTVVPSKFFGSLAVGRPVIFEGSPASAVAKWIGQYGVGWVLTRETLDYVATELMRMANSPKSLRNMQRHCHRVYDDNFARKRIVGEWDKSLCDLLAPFD